MKAATRAGVLSATYRAIGHAGRFRDAGSEFYAEHSRDPQEITGDYVSDLVAELSGHMDELRVMLARLEWLRQELDRESFPAI